jgi:hypothetical protein
MNMNAFNWKAWRIGLLLVALTSLLTAGAGLVDPQMSWRGFVAVFCSSLLTSLPLYLYRHPVPGLNDSSAASALAPGGSPADFAGTVPAKNETTNTKS